MGEAGRSPQDKAGELPRRVPGTHGRAPGEVRRGYLPPPASRAADNAAEPQRDSEARTPATEFSPLVLPARADRELPRRVRGASPGPPILARLSEPAQQTTGAELTGATEQPLQPGPSAAPPTTDAGLVAPGQVAPGPVAPGQQRPAATARRWRLIGLVIAVVALAAIAAVILLVGSPGTATRDGGRRTANPVTLEAAVRSQAVAWVASQVSRDVVIACDEPTCTDLAQHGFPAGNLNTLPSTAPDPYGSQLIIATAGLRSQFGSKLAGVFAPEVLASFGSGASRIDIRLIAPDGTAAFRAALSADQQARRASGTQLLANKRITATSLARTALGDGDVDARLLTTLAFLAIQEPIDVVGFGSQAPGASPGVPLRTVDLAETDPASRTGGSAYLRQLVAALHRQVPPYRPMSVTVVQLADRQSVLQILFGAPSPFGLLHS